MLLAGANLGWAQDADPPGRIARIEVLEGNAGVQSDGEAQARAADPQWPLTTGDRVWTDRNGRTELNIGGASVRLDGGTVIEFTTLDDNTAQMRLTQGVLAVRVRQLLPGERVEVDTPNLAVVLDQPGDWRIDVDPAQGLTRVGARAGAATVYGENAEARTVAAPERRDFTGRNLVSPGALAASAPDAFDRWVSARNTAEERSVSARYASLDIPGVQQLDNYGDWQQDATYGPVWFPRVNVADWAPYRYGRWESIAPWGWTWVDDAPWGFAPAHYGRWAQVNNRWGWVPGRKPVGRPAYAPALVGFVGNPGSNTVQLNSGRPGVAWYPLAPGEAWRPHYAASPGYVARFNAGGYPSRDGRDGHYFQSRPNAVTALAVDDFGRRAGPRGRFETVAVADLQRGQSVAPPQWQGRGGGGRPGGMGYQAGTSPIAGAAPQGFVQPLGNGTSGADRALLEQQRRNQFALEQRQQDDIRRQQQFRGGPDQFRQNDAQRQIEWQQRQQMDQQRQMVEQQQLMQQQQQQQQFQLAENQRRQQDRYQQQQRQQYDQQQQQQQQQRQLGEQQRRQQQYQQGQFQQQERQQILQQQQRERAWTGSPPSTQQQTGQPPGTNWQGSGTGRVASPGNQHE